MARTAKQDAQPDFKAIIDELDDRIEALRHAYEKYFSGVDRVAPARLHEKVERSLRALQGKTPRSTALRFRLGGVRARFVTYKHYWTRIQLQIERGATRRDLLRMRRGIAASKTPSAPPVEEAPVEEAPAQSEPPRADATSRPNGPPPPPPGKGRSPPRKIAVDPGAAGLDAKNLREVFRSLVSAKRAAGESTKGLTYAALVRKLTREAPKLRSKHKCENLRFEVSTSGGKVKVRSGPG